MSSAIPSPASSKRPSLWPVVLLAATLAFGAACQGEPEAGGRTLKIFDGDSFIMRTAGGEEIEVRLFGIDAPERSQPWSRKSRQALVGMLRGHGIDTDAVTVDTYGRTVAVVYRRTDGLNINQEMIRQGHAWVYRRYTDDPVLIRLEEEARADGRGLWGLPEAERIPPWQWRRERRARSGSGG
jgi:endonuclease YncB( thermonuclease family)